MWSIRQKYISRQEDGNLTKCRVCKQQTAKIRAIEKKTLRILLVIPIPMGKTAFEICQFCNARVHIKTDDRIIDSDME